MRLLTGLLVFSVTTISASSEDWTEFRGKHGQGHSTASLPTSWSETENISWKVPVAGVGWSSPVVTGGSIFLTTSVGRGEQLKSPQSLRLLKLDAGTGQTQFDMELFTQSSDRVQIHKKNSHASATPVIEGDRIYVHFGNHGTACVTTDGEVVWKKTLDYRPVHGNGGSPALAGDTLIVCCDGSDVQYVAGLDKNTGDIRWKSDRKTHAKKGFSFCTPTIILAGGRLQAICPGSGKVISYDPHTGDELWHAKYGEGYSVVPRPVFAHGLVYVCSGFDSAQLLAIDPTGTGDVTDSHVRWTMKSGIPRSASILVVEDEVYLVSDGGVAQCVDARSGKLIWKERIGGKYSASPTYAGGQVYFQSEGGVTTVVKADRTFRQTAKNSLAERSERTFASFAVVENAILYRSEKHLYRIEVN